MSDSEAKVSDATILESLRADIVAPPSDAKERVSNRVLLSIGALTTVAAPGVGAAKDLRSSFASALRRPLVLGLTFALGGATGAGLYATLERRPEPRIIYVAAPVEPPKIAPAVE